MTITQGAKSPNRITIKTMKSYLTRTYGPDAQFEAAEEWLVVGRSTCFGNSGVGKRAKAQEQGQWHTRDSSPKRFSLFRIRRRWGRGGLFRNYTGRLKTSAEWRSVSASPSKRTVPESTIHLSILRMKPRCRMHQPVTLSPHGGLKSQSHF